MPDDRINELRAAQRNLDRAYARRARAKKRLDEAEAHVRLTGLVVKRLVQELQTALNFELPSGVQPEDLPADVQQTLDVRS